MKEIDLFKEAIIKSGINSDDVNVIRDLSTVLYWLRNAGDVQNVNNIISKLESPEVNQDIVLKIKNKSTEDSDKSFSPILDKNQDPSSVERLAILLIHDKILQQNILGFNEFQNIISKSIELSNEEILNTFKMAKDVEDKIKDEPEYFDARINWNDYVIPSLLNKYLENEDNKLKLVSLASGEEVAEGSELEKILEWVSNWVYKNSISKNIGGFEVLGLDPNGISNHSEWEGIFKPQKHRPDYIPSAIHPLVLRILRDKKYFRDDNLNVIEEVIERFCERITKYIFENTAENPGLSSKLGPEFGFSLASFIIFHGKQLGVKITEDGIISNQTNNTYWKELIEKILDHIIFNSEDTNVTLPSWKNKRNRIIKIMNESPDWYSSSLQGYMKNKADKNIEEPLKQLKEYFLNEYPTIKVDDYYPQVEISEFTPLQDLRPTNPLIEDPHELEKFKKEIGNFKQNVEDIQIRTKEVKVKSDNATIHRKKFESISLSPFSDSVLLNRVIDENPSNPPLNSYLKNKISQLSFISKEKNDDIDSDQKIKIKSLHNNKDWMAFVNQNISTDTDIDKDAILESWSNLELFDKLRGIFVTFNENQNKEDDPELISHLYELIPDWLKKEDEPLDLNDIVLDNLRPIVSAVVFFGMPPTTNTNMYHNFVVSLEKKLGSLLALDNPTDAEKKLISFLASSRLELGLSFISAGYDFFTAFKMLDLQHTSESERITTEIIRWTGYSLQSKNAWEFKVGMNLLIMLSRISETIGDQQYFVKELISKALENSDIDKIIAYCINLIFSDNLPATDKKIRSALPLSLIAEDLTMYSREISHCLTDGTNEVIVPPWFGKLDPPIYKNPIHLLIKLIDRFHDMKTLPLERFTANGGLSGKNLIISLFQIQLDYININHRQLTVSPLTSKNQSYQKLLNLLKILRSLFCSELLFVKGFKQVENENETETPWWKLNYWTMLSLIDKDLENGSVDVSDRIFSVSNLQYAERLDKEIVPDEIFPTEVDKPSEDARVMVLERGDKELDSNGQEHFPSLKWMIRDNNNIFLIKRNKDNNNTLDGYKIENKYPLVNWMDSFHGQDLEHAFLLKAAALEYEVPQVSDVEYYDIDKRLSGDFPIFNYQHQKNELEKIITKLKKLEDDYKREINEKITSDKFDTIITHLKKPLFLNTADYKEQIEIALAQVREAEAELEVAEHESFVAEFEVLSSKLMHEAAEIEYEKYGIFKEIEDKNLTIKGIEQEIIKIDNKIKQNEGNIIDNNKEKAKYEIEKINLKIGIAQRAAQANKKEVELIRKILGIPGPGVPKDQIPIKTKVMPDGTTKEYLGQIAIMALNIEEIFIVDLEKELKEAESNLKKAKSKERARKRKANKNKQIQSVCRTVGAVVGFIYGGPAGAKLGAEIGEMVGKLYTSVIENKPLGDTVLSLANNALNIVELSGVNVEKQLTILDSKSALEIKGVFANIDSTLEPFLATMPNVWDETMVKQAFEILDLEEVPQLVELIDKTYTDLKTDSQNLQNIGNILEKAGIKNPIGFDNPKEFLTRLGDNLFENTKENIPQLKALTKAVGEDISNLNTEEKQREITMNIAKAVVTKLGQESSYFRMDAVQSWIRAQKTKTNPADPDKTWDDIREQAKDLVNRLYTDSKTQLDAESNIEMNFIDPKLMQGQIHKMIGPWQEKFDQQIDAIMKIPGDSKPSTEVEAYQQSVNVLTSAIKKFKEDLCPWLKGENNTELEDLRVKLEGSIQKQLDSMDQLEMIGMERLQADIDWENFTIESLINQDEIEQTEKYLEISELKINQASLQIKAAELAKLEKGKVMEAEKFSAEAAKSKLDASKKRIDAIKYRIESKQAQLEASTKRGAEASKIKTFLNQPSLEYDISKNKLAKIRIDYIKTLDEAFKYYREMLRFAISSGLKLGEDDGNNGDEIKLSIPNYSIINSDNKIKWSEALEGWIRKIEQDELPKISISLPSPIVYELTPLQIPSLFSKGFNIVIGYHISEKEELFRTDLSMSKYLHNENSIIGELIFNIENENPSNQDSLYLILLDDLGSQPVTASDAWKKKFLEENIKLSDNAKIINDEQERNLWHILEETPKILFTIEKRDNSHLIVYKHSPWIDEFNKYGIKLYQKSKIRKLDPGLWEISVPPDGNKIKIYQDKNTVDQILLFEIENDEGYTYQVEEDNSTNSLVIYRIYRKERGEKRSPSDDRYQNQIKESIENRFIANGIITAFYLEPIFRSSSDTIQIAKDDYNIIIRHTGDTFYSDKFPKKEAVRHFSGENKSRLDLEDWRTDFISESIDPKHRFLTDISLHENAGFPEILRKRLGIPLFGKTVIRLRLNGNVHREFDSLKVHILYSLWQRIG